MNKKIFELINTSGNEAQTKNIIFGQKEVYIEDGIIIFKDINFGNINISDEEIWYHPKSKFNKKMSELLSTDDRFIQIKNILHDLPEKREIKFINCEFEDILFRHSIRYKFTFFECNFNELKFKNIIKTLDQKKCTPQNLIYYKCNIELINNKRNKLNNLIIEKCEFDGKFYINDQKESKEKISIDNLTIKESVFNENFKLQNCEINETLIDGVDFEKNADFFKAIFIEGKKSREDDNDTDIVFNSVNVKGLTILEECEFREKFILKYVTLSGLAQLRNAKFFKGFDLDRTNSEKEMNFYGVIGLDEDSSIKKTSQETYRILKYNCERIGNIIDANKYHALELKKKKEKLEKQDKNTQESIIFRFNWTTSRFGTDWIRPFYGILILGFLTLFLLHGIRLLELFDKGGINFNFIFSLDFIYYIWHGLNKAFGYMYILNKNKEFQEVGIVFLFNKILLSYLYYQFVIAVRKDTRK